MKPPVLPDWGKDRLSDFLERAHHNCMATYAEHRNVFDRLLEIDAIFEAACSIPFRQSDAEFLLPSFIGRARGAFLAAVRLSTSGQVAETYMVARGCLENALYAFHIHGNSERAVVWLKRGTSVEATRQGKKEFQIIRVGSTLKQAHPDLAQKILSLYERTINLGAHPNADGHLTTSNLSKEGGFVDILHPGNMPWKVAVQTAAQVGLCSLHVFERILGERFGQPSLAKRLHAATACFGEASWGS